MPFNARSKLPRLSRNHYQGRACILWTHTFDGRATGWLNTDFHHVFREVLIHSCVRQNLVCPIYTLMPDHWHLVLMGLADTSDQMLATRFLRQHLGPFLEPVKLQDQAHDHILRDHELTRGSFTSACSYVRENPVRAGLVSNCREWAFSGAIVPCYPTLDWRSESFWENFWKVYDRLVMSAS